MTPKKSNIFSVKDTYSQPVRKYALTTFLTLTDEQVAPHDIGSLLTYRDTQEKRCRRPPSTPSSRVTLLYVKSVH